MSVRLTFSFDAEFDSRETALAFAVILGWRLGAAVDDAKALSEAETPAIACQPIEVRPAAFGAGAHGLH
jgi:hypothetical protein